MTASAEARDTALLAAQAAADKLATDVSIVDVSDRLAITDAFVLASAPNERQVQSIVDAVEERLREHGIKPVRREGVAESRWVLLDFVDVVVHVQHAEERAYYALERLWKDCPTIPFVDSARRAARGGRRRTTPADGCRGRPTRRRPAGDRRSPCPPCPSRGSSSGGTAAPSGTPRAASRASSTRRWTTSGRRQAAAAAPHLSPTGCSAEDTVVVSSDLTGPPRPPRALAGLLGVPLRLDERLREHGMGSWEGLTRAEVADRYPRPVRRLAGRAPGARPRWRGARGGGRARAGRPRRPAAGRRWPSW